MINGNNREKLGILEFEDGDNLVGGVYPYDGLLEEQDTTIGATAYHKRSAYYSAWQAYVGEWEDDLFPEPEIGAVREALEYLGL